MQLLQCDIDQPRTRQNDVHSNERGLSNVTDIGTRVDTPGAAVPLWTLP